MTGISPVGLRGFRPDRRTRLDPDETEGRAMYRALADRDAARSLGMARRVIYKALSTPRTKK